MENKISTDAEISITTKVLFKDGKQKENNLLKKKFKNYFFGVLNVKVEIIKKYSNKIKCYIPRLLFDRHWGQKTSIILW